MLRDILSSKEVLASLFFCILMAAGSLFYSWHVERGIKADEARTRQFLQQLEDSNRGARTQQHAETTGTEEPGQEDIPLASDDLSQTGSVATDVLSIGDEELVDAHADVSLNETSETDDAPVLPYGVSPFGFGPYPEVPPDYPDQGVWDDIRIRSMKPDHELLSRVRIKLWNQGIRSSGAVFKTDYGLVYPIIPDVVYIEWAEFVDENGKVHRYVSRQLTASETADRYEADIDKGIFSPSLTVYEFPDGGIDPHTFLDLPR